MRPSLCPAPRPQSFSQRELTNVAGVSVGGMHNVIRILFENGLVELAKY
jgi:hypothetical protein